MTDPATGDEPGSSTHWVQVTALASGSNINFSDDTPNEAGGAGASGTSTAAARGDHRHALSFGGSIEDVGSADAAGTSTSASRSDHVHAGVTSLTGGTNVTVSASQGAITVNASGGSGTLSDASPGSVSAAASAGTGTEASRDDHRHVGVASLAASEGLQVNQTVGAVSITADLSSAAPEAVGATESAGGSDETLSRSRHVHAGVTSITGGTNVTVSSSQGAVTINASGGSASVEEFDSTQAYAIGDITYTGTGDTAVVWVADRSISANSTEPTAETPQNWRIVAGTGTSRGLLSGINANVLRRGDIYWLEETGGAQKVYFVRNGGTFASDADLQDADDVIDLTDGVGLDVTAYSASATYSRGSANSIVTHDSHVWVYVSSQRNTNHDPEQFPQYWWKIDTPIRVLNHDSATTTHWRSGEFFLTETGELRMATATISASPADIIADHTGADQEFLWLNESGGGGTTVTANPSGTDGADLTRLTIGSTNYNIAGRISWAFVIDTLIVPELNQDAITDARIILEDSGLTHYLTFLDWTAANLDMIDHLPVGAHIGLRQGTTTRILEVEAEWDSTANQYQVININTGILSESASGTATELLLTAGAGGGGTTVTANPAGTDGDTLNRLTIGSTNFNLPQPMDGGLTAVSTTANLSGSGTSGSPLDIAAGGVTEDKIEDDAVTEDKIEDGAVPASKLALGAARSRLAADVESQLDPGATRELSVLYYDDSDETIRAAVSATLFTSVVPDSSITLSKLGTDVTLGASLSDADPADVGTAAASGAATDAPRRDHVHRLPIDNTLVYASDQFGVNTERVVQEVSEWVQHFATGDGHDTSGHSGKYHEYTSPNTHRRIGSVQYDFDPLNDSAGGGTGKTYQVFILELTGRNVDVVLGSSQVYSGNSLQHRFHFTDGVMINPNVRIGIGLHRTDGGNNEGLSVRAGAESQDSPRESYDDASNDFLFVGRFNHDRPTPSVNDTVGGTTANQIYGNPEIYYEIIHTHASLVGDGNVSASHISSGNASADAALLADGSGGAAFRTVVVHGDNLVDNTIPTAKYGNLSVTNAKIADVAASKVTGTLAASVIPGSLTHRQAAAVTVSGSTLTIPTEDSVQGGDTVLFVVPTPWSVTGNLTVRVSQGGTLQADTTFALNDRVGTRLTGGDVVAEEEMEIILATDWRSLVHPVGTGGGGGANDGVVNAGSYSQGTITLTRTESLADVTITDLPQRWLARWPIPTPRALSRAWHGIRVRAAMRVSRPRAGAAAIC